MISIFVFVDTVAVIDMSGPIDFSIFKVDIHYLHQLTDR